MRKIAALFIVAVCVVPTTAQAQVTLQFETNVGNFDMVLNPTNNPNLQGHVDNILGYVGLARYHFSAINRAPEGFVLQMGSVLAFPGGPDLNPAITFTPIERFDPVIVDADGNGSVDFDTTGLSNTVETVSLALSGGNVNSGTSSFFINLGNNPSLNVQGFIPFAEIGNFTTIDAIMALDQRDLSATFGDATTFGDVPITADGRFVTITDINVIDAPDGFSFVEPILQALGIESEQAAAAVVSGASIQPTANSGGGANVSAAPEPASAALAILGAALYCGRRRKR